jgi:hypothetical protein
MKGRNNQHQNISQISTDVNISLHLQIQSIGGVKEMLEGKEKMYHSLVQREDQVCSKLETQTKDLKIQLNKCNQQVMF